MINKKAIQIEIAEAINAINIFFNEAPLIKKDCDIYPDEQELYQAHSIANYISKEKGISRCVLINTIVSKYESVVVKNRKLKVSGLDIYKTKYYYGAYTAITKAKQIKTRYEEHSLIKPKIIFDL